MMKHKLAVSLQSLRAVAAMRSTKFGQSFSTLSASVSRANFSTNLLFDQSLNFHAHLDLGT